MSAAGGGLAHEGVHIPLAYLTPRGSPDPDARYSDRLSHDGETSMQELPATPLDHPTPGGRVSGATDQGAYAAISTTPEEHDAFLDQVPHILGRGAWQPWWLRRPVFGVFFGVFAVLAALVTLVYVLSLRNNGLFDADPGWVYLWRFGPTAVLTIIASAWSRMELQAMRYMPYIAIASGQSLGPNSYSLDYTGMLSPMVIIHSIKCRHGLVSVVAVTSLLLKGMIVLAPSIFRLSVVDMPTPVSVQLLDAFVEREASAAFRTDKSPYYIRGAIQDFNMSYPFGSNEKVAYQTFQLANSTPGSRGTVEAPLRVVVDGFTVDVECRQMEDRTVSVKLDASRNFTLSYYDVTVDITFEGCGRPLSLTPFSVGWFQPSSDNGGSDQSHTYWVVESNFTYTTGCSSLPQAQPQFLYFAGLFKPSAQDESEPELAEAGAVICAPKPRVSKVEVLDNGMNTTVTLLSGQEENLFTSDFTELLRVSIPYLEGQWGTSSTDVGGPVDAEANFANITLDNKNASLYRTQVLHESVTNLFGHLGALVGHFSLKQPEASNTEITGSRLFTVNRLVVDPRSAFSFVAVASITAGLMLLALFRMAPRTGIYPRDPATLLGSMLFLKDNPEFLKTPMNPSLSFKEQAAADWASSFYSPLLVRTWYRSGMVCLLLGIVGGLIFTLQKSQASDGLATVNDKQYYYFLWTSVPTLVMVVVSLSIVSANTALRSLAIFSALSSRSVDSRELDISLIDMYGPRVWHYALRMKHYVVILSEVLAILAGFLTIIVSIVFVVNNSPTSHTVELKQQTWFGAQDHSQLTGIERRRQTLGFLLVRSGISNFTYPPNTYDDLVFPELSDLPDLPINDNYSVIAKVPAVRLDAQCTRLDPSEYSVKVDSWTEEEVFYSASVSQPLNCPDGSTSSALSVSSDFPLSRSAGAGDTSYITGNLQSLQNPYELSEVCNYATTAADLDDMEYATWRVMTYFWGRFQKPQLALDFHTAWRCNYSWTTLTTTLTLFGPSRALSHDHTPDPDETTARPLTPPFPIPHLDYTSTPRRPAGDAFPAINLANTSGAAAVGAYSSAFGLLMQPAGGPFAVAAFADPDPAAQAAILRRLTHDYAFLAGQLASAEGRLGVEQRSVRAPFAVGESAVVSATVVEGGRRRLVQNAGPTWALVGVLGLVVGVNAWALVSTGMRRRGGRGRWLLNMDLKGVAPPGVGGVAVLARLVRGSSVLGRLGGRARGDVHQMFAGKVFRMGWFRSEVEGSIVYTVDVVEEDGPVAFLGSKGDVTGKESLKPSKRYPGEAKGDADRVPLRVEEVAWETRWETR